MPPRTSSWTRSPSSATTGTACGHGPARGAAVPVTRLAPASVRRTPCNSSTASASFRAAPSPSSSTTSRRPSCATGRSRTTAPTSCCTWRMRVQAASSCGGSTPHVDSAAEWWRAGEAWTSIAISHTGLVALGLPQDSLDSFPDAFRVGMAERADRLRDYGLNDPQNWDQPFGTGEVHLGVSVFSDSEETWRDTLQMARQQYEGFAGVTVLMTQDFGAQPGDLNPLGYKDSIGQPADRGLRRRCVTRPGTTDQGGRVHPRLSRRGRRAAARCLGRTCWDATARSSGCASTSRGSRRSTGSCANTPRPRRSGSCSRPSWWVAGAAGPR